MTILYLVDGEDESLLITGENLSALLGVAPIAISVSDATFGLLLYNKEDVAVYALHAEGTIALAGVPGLTLSGAVELWVNTTGEQEVDFGD
ncbi:hypothetical protein, partial [Limnospira sp. PMC 1242.20]|uniref:hypothetical protein n=1 Tax=Limnospira sp. PMC 1242.20 TaxID=2981040 RepID=UPI0028E44B7A